MGGTQDKPQPGKGSEAQQHHRSGDPAHPRPGKSSRAQGRKQDQAETSHRREDDLLREEDLHDENL
ncbi:hypothetical protein C0216_00950 [Streptomyces globosus]|uniref:Uncharacterized protein n=1 Tax=Streptomyces globosus TaxID=68209 RepID=A0A344TU75_9ACTN|nr:MULTISPECIES: hypothetical protein [Streptomyces]AXE22196.1 hypothetical protein C0216_00950 [Streptomyces globosus]